jgi:hypothetical protein
MKAVVAATPGARAAVLGSMQAAMGAVAECRFYYGSDIVHGFDSFVH